MDKHEFSRAIAHLEKSVNILPDNISVYNYLAHAYIESGSPEKAREIYLKGLSLFPTYPQFNFGLGYLAQIDKNYSEAKKYYGKALKAIPDYGQALENLGLINEVEGQLDSALFYYEHYRQLGLDKDNKIFERIQRIQRNRQKTSN